MEHVFEKKKEMHSILAIEKYFKIIILAITYCLGRDKKNTRQQLILCIVFLLFICLLLLVMETINKHSIHLIGTADRTALIESIAKALSKLLDDKVTSEIVPHQYFANGECNPELLQSVRGKHVYAVIDTNSHDQA